MDEGTFSDATGGICSENTPLTDFQRNVIIVAHYLTFPVCTFALWALNQKYDVIRTRIWSPFVLMIGLAWLQIGPAFEIATHHYVDHWELKNSQGDLINASFSFFNFGAQNINALSLRKKGHPWVRPVVFTNARDIFDFIAMIGDFLLIGLTIAQPIVYATLGRSMSVSILSPFASVAGLFTLFRLGFNLGPNKATIWGGILFFVFAMLGVVMLVVYRQTCIEFVHLGIGGSFVTSVIPFSVALLNAEYSRTGNSQGVDVEEGNAPSESTPLNK